jgi:predicted O-methyltransferase YrrM
MQVFSGNRDDSNPMRKDLSFCPVLAEMYANRVVVGRSGKEFRSTSGLSTLNNLSVIRRLCMERKPSRTLEIGMACGGSALTIASSHRDLGRKGQLQHVAIDGFQRTGFDDVGRMQLARAGLEGYVSIDERLSSIALADMYSRQEKFDFIYVDGSHRFEDVFVDFYFARFLLSIDGVILFDDCSDAEVLKVVRFIRRNLSEAFESIPAYKLRDASGVQRVKLDVAERVGKTQLAGFVKRLEDERQPSRRVRAF